LNDCEYATGVLSTLWKSERVIEWSTTVQMPYRGDLGAPPPYSYQPCQTPTVLITTMKAPSASWTIVPSRRAHYVVHPKQLIAITKKKQKRRERKSKQWIAEQRLIQRLRQRTDDAPVDAGAPSHLSYVTILWHRDRAVRRTQMEAARAFLEEQKADKKSLLHKFEVIGPLELEAK
jgi:Holliday junction resolvase-like predicted endonuclease